MNGLKKKKKVGQSHSYQESFTHLDKTSYQLQHSLKPKPSQEEGPHACSQSLQSRLTLCNPMDCNACGSSVHWILQARK